jgi:hypothetical protein
MAATEADKIVHAIVSDLSDGTSISYTHGKSPLTSDWFANYWQYGSFKWKLEPEPLTLPEDHLNGIIWRGTIHSTIDTLRSLHEGFSSIIENKFAPCWTPWWNMPSEYNFTWKIWRRNGEWKSFRIDDIHFPEAPMGDDAPTQKDADRVLKYPNCE